jgi:long-chain-fatty-acid---luciferin-component ligase
MLKDAATVLKDVPVSSDWTVDKFLHIKNPWALDPELQRELLVQSIKEAVVYHYDHNRLYKRLCDNRKFNPQSIESTQDFIRIPVISTQAFKSGLDLLSIPKDDVVIINKSSGTSGRPSLVPRDRITVDRFKQSIKQIIRNIQPIHQGFLAMMSPSFEDYKELTMAYMSQIGCELADNHEFYMKNFTFNPADVVKALNSVKERPVWIGGGPMLIMSLAKWIESTGQRIETLTELSGVSSGGGFKTHTGESISRQQYNAVVSQAFGVDEKNIRDAYGMTELNAFAMECEHHMKHLPPWIHVSIRNPSNFDEELPAGEEGLPVFLDPLAHSYPGFIIADDIAKLALGSNEMCSCGKPGIAFSTDVRRAEGAEEKGCGRQVDSLRQEAAKV